MDVRPKNLSASPSENLRTQREDSDIQIDHSEHTRNSSAPLASAVAGPSHGFRSRNRSHEPPIQYRDREVERIILEERLDEIDDAWIPPLDHFAWIRNHIPVPTVNQYDYNHTLAETDIPASGDTMDRGILPLDALIQRLNLVESVSSGYLASNESEASSAPSNSTTSTTSTETEDSVDYEARRVAEYDLYFIESLVSQYSQRIVVEPTSSSSLAFTEVGSVVVENGSVMELDPDESESGINNLNLNTSFDIDNRSSTVIEQEEEPELSEPDEEEGNESSEVWVNTKNPENCWKWDQRGLCSPVSVQELDDSSVTSVNVYMQTLIDSTSENIFIRPVSNSGSGVEICPNQKPKALKRSISYSSFFRRIPDSNRTSLPREGSCSEPKISLHYETQLDSNKNELKRFTSLDSLGFCVFKGLELYSIGDFVKTHEPELEIAEKVKPDSGKSTPNGSSVRSKRIDNLLCSLFSLVVVNKDSRVTVCHKTASQCNEDLVSDLESLSFENLELAWRPSTPDASKHEESTTQIPATGLQENQCQSEKAACKMRSSKLKNVKFDNKDRTSLDSNHKIVFGNETPSRSSSEESIDFSPIPTRFRQSVEFSKKEESIRPKSTALDISDEIERKRRPRSVNFEDERPFPRAPSLGFCRNPVLAISDISLGKGKSPSKPESRKLSKSCLVKNSKFLSPSSSELFQVKTDLAYHSRLIDDSVQSLEQLLSNLQNLWLNVKEEGNIPTLSNSSGDHRLAQLTSLCLFIVKEMEPEWKSFAASSIDTEKLEKLEGANCCLREQLESSRVIHSCLESEITYMAKEKVLLKEEIKHLAMHSAKLEDFSSKEYEKLLQTPNIDCTQRHVCPQSSSDSFGSLLTKSSEGGCNSKIWRPKFPINEAARLDTTKKLESDFNSVVNFIRERGSDFNYYKTQLDKYDEEVLDLKRQVEITAAERAEMKNAYETLRQEHMLLTRERGHYEGVLKLILQEKQTNEHSLQDLMEILIQKLNSMSAENDGPNSARYSLLEGALQAVQEQNSNYREEIECLKKNFTDDVAMNSAEKVELEASYKFSVQQIQELTNILLAKSSETTEMEKSFKEKLSKMEEVFFIVSQEKAQLDIVLAAKEGEMAKIKETMESLQKNGLRQQKKIIELQKVNTNLTRDILEQKNNMEALSKIVHQLRSNLKEQKTLWAERLKATGDEAIQTKDHCKWLQNQIDNLNGQLKDAHERMKAHEKDKSNLAQQVLTAEEERKIIDRRFQELRTAMSGDLVLRQALAERNEALQSEITRMRRAKLMSLGNSLIGGLNNDDGEFDPPPSEMSSLDPFSSLNSLPPSLYTGGEKQSVCKKNRYTSASYANANPTNKSPRAAVSCQVHSSGHSSSGNGN